MITERPVIEHVYVCDILNKEIPKEEVYATVKGEDGRIYCISRDAVRNLPTAISNDKFLLMNFMFGCGPTRCPPYILPGAMFRGTWVMEVVHESSELVHACAILNHPNIEKDTKFPEKMLPYPHIDAFKSEEDAFRWVKNRVLEVNENGLRYWIFTCGELMGTYISEMTPIISGTDHLGKEECPLEVV